MNWNVIMGYVAAAATTLAFLPQAIKTVRTKDTKGISLRMYSLFCFGVLMWLLYGIGEGDLPIILANGITLVFGLVILITKIRYR